MPRALAFLIIVLLLCGSAQAKLDSPGPRPLTQKEEETFLPLVCEPFDNTYEAPPIDYSKYSVTHSCSKFLNKNDYLINDDSPMQIRFTSILYGSFSKSSADEAYVSYDSNIFKGEVNRTEGDGILFSREKGKWNTVNPEINIGSIDKCIVVPGNSPQRMLCLKTPQMCCGTSNEYIQIVDWLSQQYIKPLISAHDGRRDDVDDSGFCEAGKAGKIVLIEISEPRHSTQPDAFAEADITYLKPATIRGACNTNSPYSAKPIKDKIYFAVKGDEVKVILPKGIQAFSKYNGDS